MNAVSRPLRRPIVGLTLLLMLSLVRAASGQSSLDSTTHRADDPTRAWLSLGVGGGNSRRGGIAGRAAATLAVNPNVTFTLSGTSVGGVDGSDDSINLMAGVKSPDPDGFFFVSAGLALISCGSGCANQTGLAVDGGLHIGGRYAGVALAGFSNHAAHASLSGIVLAIDLGLFGERRVPSTSVRIRSGAAASPDRR